MSVKVVIMTGRFFKYAHNQITNPKTAPLAGYQKIVVFRGTLPAAPRVGEEIEVFNWGSLHKVQGVFYSTESDEVGIEIPPDSLGVFEAEAKKRGIRQFSEAEKDRK